MNKKEFTIGTRGSRLALAQSGMMMKRLETLWPEHSFRLEVFRTQGDRMQKWNEQQLAEAGVEGLGKGLFTKELEDALLKGEIDLAVHSLKDLPVELPEGLTLGAVPERESPNDVVFLKAGVNWEEIGEGDVFVTGSKRRGCQWREKFRGCEVVGVRGNIDTRIRKLMENDVWKGMILAEAGFNRLSVDLGELEVKKLSVQEMIPAPGQGALGIEIREGDGEVENVLMRVHDPRVESCVHSERRFLEVMGGGCQAPLGAYAQWDGEDIVLTGVFYSGEDDVQGIRKEVRGKVQDDLGKALADAVKEELSGTSA